MVGETMTDTWFNNIWKSSRRSISSRERDTHTIGILSFEISRLMSKVVNLWQCLSDGQIFRMKEKIVRSVGILKLVSVDESHLMDLALAEMIENLRAVARSVSVLGKKCADSKYHSLENVFDQLDGIDPKWFGWQYKSKKIEKKIKKMERFSAVTEQLYQELEVLAELEQTLRRMRASADLSHVKLLEFQQKVAWQRQDVKNLREMSPWVKTYDYIVRLLLRSLFTIVERVKYVYTVNHHGLVDPDCVVTVPVVLGRSISNLGLVDDKTKSKNKKTHIRSHSSIHTGKRQEVAYSMAISFFDVKNRVLNPPPSSLGYAALSLHYANLIILIEKLASAAHLISLDARDDLYNMLPSTIKSSLRSKLKTFSRNSYLCFYDDAFAGEWRLAIARILEWLSPLANDMIKWQSERNIERQRLIYGSNVLLVQTLYFANQAETEAAIVELLMGINYLSRFGKPIDERPGYRLSSCSRACDDHLFVKENISSKPIDH